MAVSGVAFHGSSSSTSRGRGTGTLEAPLFSDMLGEQPDLFSSLGREPSRNFPHNHNDDPSNEADG